MKREGHSGHTFCLYNLKPGCFKSSVAFFITILALAQLFIFTSSSWAQGTLEENTGIFQKTTLISIYAPSFVPVSQLIAPSLDSSDIVQPAADPVNVSYEDFMQQGSFTGLIYVKGNDSSQGHFEFVTLRAGKISERSTGKDVTQDITSNNWGGIAFECSIYDSYTLETLNTIDIGNFNTVYTAFAAAVGQDAATQLLKTYPQYFANMMSTIDDMGVDQFNAVVNLLTKDVVTQVFKADRWDFSAALTSIGDMGINAFNERVGILGKDVFITLFKTNPRDAAVLLHNDNGSGNLQKMVDIFGSNAISAVFLKDPTRLNSLFFFSANLSPSLEQCILDKFPEECLMGLIENQSPDFIINLIKKSDDPGSLIQALAKIISTPGVDSMLRSKALDILGAMATDTSLDPNIRTSAVEALGTPAPAPGSNENNPSKSIPTPTPSVPQPPAPSVPQQPAQTCSGPVPIVPSTIDGWAATTILIENSKSNPHYAETLAYVKANMNFDSSVSAEDRQKFIDAFTAILLTGRADYLRETLLYTKFTTNNGFSYDGYGIVSADPGNINVVVHEAFHSFWEHHAPARSDSAMEEGFGIAAAEAVVYGNTDLAEKVFGTKLYYMYGMLEGFTDIPLGDNILKFADPALQKVMDYIQSYDYTNSGFNWRDQRATENYWNKIWSKLDREAEDYYFSVLVPNAIQQMQALNSVKE
jgi:hypothetical protein